MKNEKNEDDMRFFLDYNYRFFNDVDTRYNELLNRKYTWFFQIITIASTIIAGFVLSNNDRNYIDNIALLIIFILNFFSLYIIMILNRQEENELIKVRRENAKLFLLTSSLISLEKKENPTKKDIQKRNDIYKAFKNQQKDMMNFTPEDIDGLFRKDENNKYTINLGTILIIGIFLSLILLIFSNQLTNIIDEIIQYLGFFSSCG